MPSHYSVAQESEDLSLDEMRTRPTPEPRGQMEMIRRIEQNLDNYVPPSIKRGVGRLPEIKANDEQDHLDFLPDSVISVSVEKEQKVRVATRARKSTRKSTRLQEEQKREEAQSEEECADEENEVRKEGSRQRNVKPLAENTLFELRQKQTRLNLIWLPATLKWWSCPEAGQFGEGVGYEGGNYIYHQNKRTYEAKVQLAETNETEPEYDDTTDNDEDLPRPVKRKDLGVNIWGGLASTDDVLDDGEAQASTDRFEASEEYLEWLHNG